MNLKTKIIPLLLENIKIVDAVFQNADLNKEHRIHWETLKKQYALLSPENDNLLVKQVKNLDYLESEDSDFHSCISQISKVLLHQDGTEESFNQYYKFKQAYAGINAIVAVSEHLEYQGIV